MRFFPEFSGGAGDGARIVRFLTTQGASHSLSEPTTNQPTKQMFNIVRFFPGQSRGAGDGAQIVRFFPGFPGVPGMGHRL